MSVRERYDRLAATYDADSAGEAQYWEWRRMAEKLVAYLPPRSDILDLGCGTGLSGTVLIPMGHELTGMDLSEGMLAKAEERGYVELVEGDIHDRLPFGHDSFDAVLCLGVTEFIDDIPALLSETARVTDRRGYLAITFPKQSEATKRLGLFAHTEEAARAFLDSSPYETVEWETIRGYTKPEGDVEYFCAIAQKR